jgi:hypothetical protein
MLEGSVLSQAGVAGAPAVPAVIAEPAAPAAPLVDMLGTSPVVGAAGAPALVALGGAPLALGGVCPAAGGAAGWVAVLPPTAAGPTAGVALVPVAAGKLEPLVGAPDAADVSAPLVLSLLHASKLSAQPSAPAIRRQCLASLDPICASHRRRLSASG